MSDFSTEGDFEVELDIGDTSVPAGEQYTSTLGFPFGGEQKPPVSTPVVQEKTVRPFEAYRERRDQRLAQLRAPPEIEVLAQACWGGTTDFPQTSTPATDVTSGFPFQNFTTKDRDDSSAPPEDKVEENWRERFRSAEEVEIASEEDPEMTITIQVATQSVFDVPSLTVSKTTGSGKTRKTESFTIPQRKIRIAWRGKQGAGGEE